MKKVEQISKLRPTQPRQKMLEIFSYLGEISNGPKTDDEQPDTTDKPEKSVEQKRKNQKKV